MPVGKPRRGSLTRLLFGILTLVVAAAWRPALAQIGSDRYAATVVDAASGNILSAVNADEYRYPASLTKMMTLYLLFESLRDGRLSLADAVPISAWAASMPPTKLGLLPGSSITVEQAVLGLVTKSANDAAAALGELMGGDESRFAQMMTLRARALGMSRTTFRNASGLPDWGQVTTARDLVILARRLIQDFPMYYRYFSTPSFQFGGRTILNHQRLLQTYAGADGLKTGYIEASGYNVVTSAMRGDVRLIGVVMGAGSGSERDLQMASLLDQGFERMGVPVEMVRREAPERFALIGTANAAAAERRAPAEVAEARAPRLRAGRALLRPVGAARRQPAPRELRARVIGLRSSAPLDQRGRPRAVMAIRPMPAMPARAAPPTARTEGNRTARGVTAWRSRG